MPVQFYRHISLYGPLVSAFPEVPCLIRSGKPQLLQIHLQNSFLLPGIEKASRHGTVGQLLHPHLEIPLVPRFAGGTGSRILIHRYHLIIGKQSHRKRINMLQITGDDERSGQQAPQGHMGVLFIRSQPRLDKRGVGLVGFAQLPDLEDVRIIPMSRAHMLLPAFLGKTDAADAAPVILDIPRRPP